MGQQISKPAALELWAAGLSDKGRIRANNEDSFLVEQVPGRQPGLSQLICLVADGMGGQDYGEIASRTAVQIFHQQAGYLHKMGTGNEWLNHATREAHTAIKCQYTTLNAANGMGSTLVAGLFVNERCFLANVGDSRAYLLRQGILSRLTRDHSLMEIMLEKGLIKPEEVYCHPRRGELTHFLGQNDEVEADIYEINLQAADVILFCSDGLWEMVRDPDLAAILAANADPVQAVNKLIDAANQAGGTDNITAVVVRVGESRQEK